MSADKMIGTTPNKEWAYALVCVLCLSALYVRGQTANTTIAVSAPLNTVKEGEMLSIHCQIWNLESDYIVVLQRIISGTTEIISFDETLQGSVDNRFFLAQRRLSTGSIVFFLSIIEVTRRTDEGEYQCKVVKKTLQPVVIGKVFAKVQFFPSETFPQCSSSVGNEVKSGTQISFNCTSEAGHPLVDLKWTTTGSGEELDSKQGHSNGIAYSHVTLQASMQYDEAVFICEMSSTAFPSINPRTCHVGPLTVKPDPFNPEPDLQESDNRETERTKAGGSFRHPISDPNKTNVKHAIETAKDCEEVCSSLSSSVFYWVVATVVAGGLALIFLLIGIVLAIKLCKIPQTLDSEAATGNVTYRQPLEDLYERIECSRDDNQMYMALHGLRKPDNLVVQTHIPVQIEGNYTRTPTAPVVLASVTTTTTTSPADKLHVTNQ